MTILNPLKPLVLILNPLTFSYNFSANQYYYYTIEIQRPYDGFRVFTGKAWAKQYNYTAFGEITIDISAVVKPYLYSGYNLLKPIYNPETMQIESYWMNDGQFITSLNQEVYSNAGFGSTIVYVHFYSSTTNMTVNNAVAVKEVHITSSWNIRENVYETTDSFNCQELSKLEFGQTFISHYPKVNTTNFGIFGLVNMSEYYWRNAAQYNNNIILKVGNDEFTAIKLLGDGENIYVGGYTPFKINLSTILPTLTEWSQVEIPTNNIYGGNSNRAAKNTFTTGTSVPYEVNNIYSAGNAKGHGTYQEGYDYSNSIYYIPMKTSPITIATNRGEGWYHFAELDECYSRYYLVWMTKSCAPACYGFGGNTVYSEDYSHTTLTNMYNMELSKIQNVTKNYQLRTGIIDKQTYTVMEDIYTSPWCLLYDTHTDKSVYVRPVDNTFTRKNTIKEDKRPFTFEVNMQELDKIEILR